MVEHDTSPKRPRRRPGENRERLIAAGVHEFGAYGYRGASTSAIAARAEVPQPHVYANFRTKQELFLACAERVVTACSDRAPDPNHQLAAPHTSLVEGELTLFLLQLVAAARDPELDGEPSELLARLEQRLGRAEVEAVLARALTAALNWRR